MITLEGKSYIKRYLAAQVPSVASCIAYGLGSKSEAVGDTSLQFEVGRAPIVLTSYDFLNDRVVFKTVLPDDLSALVYEVALFSQVENPMAGNFGSKVLASFDSDSEVWTRDTDGAAAVYDTSLTNGVPNARIGGDSLSLVLAASAATGYVLNDVLYDLSGNSGADVFKLAYNVVGAAPASVVIRFRTDASNYYSYTVTSPAAGYRIDTFTKGSAAVTGSPNWANITGIEVRVTAAAGAGTTVNFDGLRVEDTDTVNPEYVMVSRDLLATPFTKVEGKPQEIEFSLSVNVT